MLFCFVEVQCQVADADEEVRVHEQTRHMLIGHPGTLILGLDEDNERAEGRDEASHVFLS